MEEVNSLSQQSLVLETFKVHVAIMSIGSVIKGGISTQKRNFDRVLERPIFGGQNSKR